MKSTRRGSILMEFVIVLPIYFILLGSAFVVGELALHSIHLSAQADRGMAYFVEAELEGAEKTRDKDSFMRQLRNVLSFNTKRKDGPLERDYDFQGSDVTSEGGSVKAKLSEFDEDANCRHIDVIPDPADEDNPHQFTKAVAGRAIDNYTLSPLSRGFIAHWFFESNRRTHGAEGAKMMTETTEAPEEDAIDKILKKGELGRTEVYGNYMYDETGNQVRQFGYYSLQRNEMSRLLDGYVPFRSSGASVLAKGQWKELKLVEDDSLEEKGEKIASVKRLPDEANEGSDIYIIYGGLDNEKSRDKSSTPPHPYEFPTLL